MQSAGKKVWVILGQLIQLVVLLHVWSARKNVSSFLVLSKKASIQPSHKINDIVID